jgi:hypothetical protein
MIVVGSGRSVGAIASSLASWVGERYRSLRAPFMQSTRSSMWAKPQRLAARRAR